MKNSLFSLLCAALLLHFGETVQGSVSVLEWKNYLKTLEALQSHHETTYKIQNPSRTPREAFFNVSFETPPVKKTVHRLRPQDIDVLGAMGDSITAGTGAGALRFGGVGIQFRGISWLAGGDEELEKQITLATILRKFNPKIKGYSSGSALGTTIRTEEDWFNVAVPGDRAFDMLYQATRLVDLIKNDSRSSLDNDWKLVSIFIGYNDLCAVDRDPDGATPESYVSEIKKSLDFLHDQLPRAIVQVVQILELYRLMELPLAENTHPLCNTTLRLFCGAISNGWRDDEMIEINRQYQVQLKELINSGIYDTRDDFTVVLQPFLENTVLPVTEEGNIDASYFAPDCFHFGSKGHALGAISAWNNMLEPIGGKSTQWSIDNLKCPNQENPYIFTSGNSLHTKHGEGCNVIEEKAESPCVYEECNKIPGWATGTTIGLGAAVAAEAIFMMILQRGRKCL